ncbi:MAG TPA: hypothetical protein VJ985_05380, partial [Gammaproteobacteria bacterium]|nr:hypothetical protein [Gammaproteobacteria bacterium]
LRTVTVRLARTLDRGLAGLAGRARGTEEASTPVVLGSLVYWVVLLAAVTAATQVLALESFGAWLERLVGYLPVLLAGGLILMAGFFIAALARNLVIATAPTTPDQAAVLGRALQVVILLTALVLGADQVGLEVTFLVTLGTVVAGALAGGLVLAASLGSGTFVANLIGAHHLRQQYRPGQLLRVGDYEGRVLALTATTLVLDCPEGRVSLPGKAFNEQPIILRPEGTADE